MFKVGDRVRCVAGSQNCTANSITKGKVYVVVGNPGTPEWDGRCFKNNTGVFIQKDHGNIGWSYNERFELVKPEAPSIMKQDNVRVRIAVEGQTTRAFGSLTEAKVYAGRYYLTTGIVPKLHVFQDFHLDWTPDVH